MLKKMFSIDALTEYGALGAGEISARLVNNRLSPLILKDAKTYQNFSPAVPILLGAVLSKGVGGNFLGNLGRGMIANGVGNVISRLVDKDGTIGLTGGDEVLMAGDEVLMRGGGGGGNDFSAGDAYDYTSAEAGEMDY